MEREQVEVTEAVEHNFWRYFIEAFPPAHELKISECSIGVTPIEGFERAIYSYSYEIIGLQNADYDYYWHIIPTGRDEVSNYAGFDERGVLKTELVTEGERQSRLDIFYREPLKEGQKRRIGFSYEVPLISGKGVRLFTSYVVVSNWFVHQMEIDHLTLTINLPLGSNVRLVVPVTAKQDEQGHVIFDMSSLRPLEVIFFLLQIVPPRFGRSEWRFTFGILVPALIGAMITAIASNYWLLWALVAILAVVTLIFAILYWV